MSRPSKSQATRGSYSTPSRVPTPPTLNLAYLKEFFSTETYPKPHAGTGPKRRWRLGNGQFITDENGADVRTHPCMKAATKSECRAELKKLFRVRRLPVGTKLIPL